MVGVGYGATCSKGGSLACRSSTSRECNVYSRHVPGSSLLYEVMCGHHTTRKTCDRIRKRTYNLTRFKDCTGPNASESMSTIDMNNI